MAAVLERPDALSVQPARPVEQRSKAARSDLDRLVAEQLAGRRCDRSDGVRALVHVRTEHDHPSRPLSSKADARRTRLVGGAATLLSSHAAPPRPAARDTTKASQAPTADSVKASQLAAGPGPSPQRRTPPTPQILTTSVKAEA